MNWKAYKLGQDDCKKSDGSKEGYNNPYKEGTEDFLSYRRGWNEYWNEKWKET